MGFRFTLQSANTVANLSFGKVMSCYRDITSSEQRFYEFKYFLDHFEENLYSNRKSLYSEEIYKLSHDLLYLRQFDYEFFNKNKIDEKYEKYSSSFIDSLFGLSKIFQSCKIKSILLPGITNYDDGFMTSEYVLRDIVSLHPSDSCLILQPEDRPSSPVIFDAFPNFDVALRQADLWPAVFFWKNEREYALVPVDNVGELKYLYKIVDVEKNPIPELKRHAEGKSHSQKYVYHLSDLHLGSADIKLGESRLKSLIKKQIATLNISDQTKVIITGDAVDSPNRADEERYDAFAEYIKQQCGEVPLLILGNHDINSSGLAFTHINQKQYALNFNFPRIEKLEEYKILFLLFNSNTNGFLAQGEIGAKQMCEMGNLLDEIDNLEEYTLIAVLHHHLTDIPNPDEFNKKYFKFITEQTLKLNDAKIFYEWLCKRKVKIVLHGHKHIPYFVDNEGISVIACGSSTGKVKMKDKEKTYISYNLLKIESKQVTCTQYVEDIYGAGAKDIRTEIIKI